MLSEAITKDQIEVALDGVEPIFAGPESPAAAATGTITLAFASDPVARWTYPDPDQYLNHFPAFVRAFAGGSFTEGTAYLAPGGGGAALWLGPGIEPNEDELVGLIWSSTSDQVQRDLFPMLKQMEAFHPSEPHWYLSMIGVEPSRQGSGVGSALLQHTLATCDIDGLPAYLESTNPRNIPLYERFGFEQIGVIRSGDAPPLFPMIRRPRRAWDNDTFRTKS
jgi:ribosomal protein S18 acetylase RimI-like enzyme